MIESIQHIDWTQFHFLRPHVLWAELVIAAVFLIGLLSFRDEEKWKNTIAVHLRPYVIQKGSGRLRLIMHAILSLTLAIACAGLAGPTWNEREVPGKILETPVVIALDLSQSMIATDIQPSRLERAKFKISDFLDANPRARVALVGFAGTAHTIVPLCQDNNIVKSHLKALSPNVLPFPGTDFSAVFRVADTICNVTDAPAKIILVTDLIDDDLFEEIQTFTAAGNRTVELMPMNTTTGAEIPKPGSKYVFKDKSGNAIRSSLDNEKLNKLASLESVHVNRLTLDKSDIEHLADLISSDLNFQEEDDKKENDWEDRGLLLVLPLAFFMLLFFRKGFVIYSCAFLMVTACNQDQTINDWFYSKDYQAQKLLDSGEFEQAAETFDDPMRKGVAYYKVGNYEAAIEAFRNDTAAEAAYNLGLAYFKNGDYAAAQLAFGEAVEKNPDLKDAATNQQLLGNLIDAHNEVKPEDAQEQGEKANEDNIQNNDPEDLGGGGQKATEDQMKDQRKEETVTTEVRKGKELEEVPDDLGDTQSAEPQKVLMRKVDDDPALFLKRKFKHEAKVKKMMPAKNLDPW